MREPRRFLAAQPLDRVIGEERRHAVLGRAVVLGRQQVHRARRRVVAERGEPLDPRPVVVGDVEHGVEAGQDAVVRRQPRVVGAARRAADRATGRCSRTAPVRSRSAGRRGRSCRTGRRAACRWRRRDGSSGTCPCRGWPGPARTAPPGCSGVRATHPGTRERVEVRRAHERVSGGRQAVAAELVERDEQDVDRHRTSASAASTAATVRTAPVRVRRRGPPPAPSSPAPARRQSYDVVDGVDVSGDEAVVAVEVAALEQRPGVEARQRLDLDIGARRQRLPHAAVTASVRSCSRRRRRPRCDAPRRTALGRHRSVDPQDGRAGGRRRTLGQSADRRARAHDDIGTLSFEGGDRLGDALLDRRIGEPVAPSRVEQIDPHVVHGVGGRARVHPRAGRTWRRARRRCAGTRSSSSGSRYAAAAAQRPTTNRRMAATTSAPAC